MVDLSAKFISVTTIVHPKTEKEIEVFAIKTSPRPQLRDHQLTIYIDPTDGSVFTRNYTDTEWCLWVPIPFNRQLHNRMIEGGYKSTANAYVPDPVQMVNFNDLPQEQQEFMLRRLKRMKQ